MEWREVGIMIKNLIKKLPYVLIKCVLKFVELVYKFCSGNGEKSCIAGITCRALETKTEYISYQIMPKDTSLIPILNGLNQSSSFAIIMQGPLCQKDDMTANSIKFYKKAYPLSKIIVSTWKDESEEYIRKITELGAVVVQSERPSCSGIMNVNYQLTSSLVGVEKAKEMGCEFAVKTRTDQRICKPFIFDSMISAIKLFPGGEGQKGRLVTLGVCDGGMFTPYFTCDFLYLGYVDDLLSLFSAPFDNREDDKNLRDSNRLLTRRQLAEQTRAPEIYILKHYCKDFLKLNGEDTVKEHWNVTKNYLICYGMNDVNLLWNKYDRLYNLNFYSSAYFNGKDSLKCLRTMCFDFANWFNLYAGNIKYDERYEQYAEVSLDGDGKKNS